MNLSAIFIKRPVATILLMLGMLFYGIVGYRALPINDMPNIEFPYIIVFATIPGADPETMATSVAKPLEEQLSSVSGIKQMSSTSTQSVTTIFIEFELDENIDSAALDVQAAISVADSLMPDSMPTPPIYFKLNPDSLPVINIAVTSDSMTLQQLTEYAETYIAQELSMISGVAQTRVTGAKRYAVRVQIDPARMAALGIGVDEIVNAVGAANVVLPTGVLQGENRLRNIKVDGQLHTASEFADVIIAWKNGSPIRLGDVADVLDSVEGRDQKAWIDDQEGIVVQVVRQPGGNTVELVQRIYEELPGIQATLPPSLQLEVVKDNSIFIRDSLHEVIFTLQLTVCLVIIVIFVFLRNFTATIIPSLALPFTIMATFAAMYALGFTLNNVSMMALILAVGLVVDDAIVMLENIIRHREMGKSPYDAAMDGSKEIGFTIVSMTVSLCAVFVPILFMPGLVGKMFFEFGAVMIIALGISGIVSISLTPMLANQLLSSHAHASHQHGFLGFLSRMLDGLHGAYAKSLRVVMRHKFKTFVGSLLLLVLMGYLIMILDKGFFPNMDGSSISVSTKAEESISFEALAEAQASLHQALLDDPAVKNFVSSVGGVSFFERSNTGTIDIVLHPPSERDHVDVVIERMRESLNTNPNLEVYVANGTQTGGGGAQGSDSYAFVGTDLEELQQVALMVEEELDRHPMLRDVSSDLELKNPIIEFKINRDLATSLGITVAQIESTLYSSFGQREISTIYDDLSNYKVIMEVSPELQKQGSSVLAKMNLKTYDGRLIPLETLVTQELKTGPLAVGHIGQFPSVVISFNLAEGYARNVVIPELNALFDEMLPDSVSYRTYGGTEEYESSMSGMLTLVIVALVLIYLILGILYESFIHPITILSGLPSAAVGAFIALFIFDQELNMTSILGVIMLIGIVKKNAIMILDFALEAQRSKNLDAETAAVQGCLTRFRPIMMTTLAAIMGALPLALGVGETGADMRIPLGVSIAGGLIFSQVVTLYITPVYFVYLERFSQFLYSLVPSFWKRNAEESQQNQTQE